MQRRVCSRLSQLIALTVHRSFSSSSSAFKVGAICGSRGVSGQNKRGQLVIWLIFEYVTVVESRIFWCLLLQCQQATSAPAAAAA